MENNTDLYSNPYSLSIRFTADGFSLYVFDKNQKMLTSSTIERNLTAMSESDIIEILSEQKEFSMKFESVRIIVESNQFSIVPASVFKPENIEDFLKFRYQELSKNTNYLYNELIAWNAIVIFSCNNALYNALNSVFPEIETEHHLFAFFNDYIPLKKQAGLFVEFRKEFTDIVLVQNNNILFYNSYECKTPEDFAYYILKINEQHQIDNNTCNLLVSNSKKKTEYVQLISKYIPNYETINVS